MAKSMHMQVLMGNSVTDTFLASTWLDLRSGLLVSSQPEQNIAVSVEPSQAEAKC